MKGEGKEGVMALNSLEFGGVFHIRKIDEVNGLQTHHKLCSISGRVVVVVGIVAMPTQ